MTPVIFVVDVDPQPKQRPRVANGHAYTPTKTREYENHVAWLARIAMGERPPMTAAVGVRMDFQRTDRRRVDLDNMAKAVMDAINGVCFVDDWQVEDLHATLERGAAESGVRVEVWEL